MGKNAPSAMLGLMNTGFALVALAETEFVSVPYGNNHCGAKYQK